MGVVTCKWLSPGMLGENDPLSLSIEAWRQNDIWAFGRVLLAMADACCAGGEKGLSVKGCCPGCCYTVASADPSPRGYCDLIEMSRSRSPDHILVNLGSLRSAICSPPYPRGDVSGFVSRPGSKTFCCYNVRNHHHIPTPCKAQGYRHRFV
jgi:hypothetical protein